MVDFVYRWRLALALGLIPVLLAALALSVEPAQPNDPLIGGQDDEASSMEAFLSGFGIESPRTAGSRVSPKEQAVTPFGGDDESASPLPPVSTTTALSTTTPPTTVPTTTAPSTTLPPATTAPSTTLPPATTALPPTEPPTTEPPATTTTIEATTAPLTTAQACMVSVRRRAPLRAEPDDDSDRLGRAKRGTFPGLAIQEGWVLINYNGTVGWIEDRLVSGVDGDC
ncbi:MAG: SH3 domain-containing protein [Acidimicrobiales bacterium]